jgi:hypothetical protein
MAQRDEIKRRLLLRLFGDPLTIGLGVIGISALFSPLLFPIEPAMPLFVGVSGLVSAVGLIAIKLLLAKEQISSEVHAELKQEATARTEADLDQLSAELEGDNDPRTERYLTDMRVLIARFSEDDEWKKGVNVVAEEDITVGIAALFEGCVKSLRRSLVLADTLAAMSTEAARASLQMERERLLTEVETSIAALSKLITDLNSMGSESDEESPDLSRIRNEIDLSLKAARVTARETKNISVGAEARKKQLAAIIKEKV